MSDAQPVRLYTKGVVLGFKRYVARAPSDLHALEAAYYPGFTLQLGSCVFAPARVHQSS